MRENGKLKDAYNIIRRITKTGGKVKAKDAIMNRAYDEGKILTGKCLSAKIAKIFCEINNGEAISTER